MSMSIKINEDNYNWLMKVAGKLQAERKKRATIDDALEAAGMLKMSDKEVEKMKKGWERGWKNWKIRSV